MEKSLCKAAYFKGSLGIEEAIQLEELGNKSGPAGLVTGTQPGAIVAVEAFKEVDVVVPERVALELFRGAVDGRRPLSSRRKIRVSRFEISLLTSKRFIRLCFAS